MWDERQVAVERVVVRAAPSESSAAVETLSWGATFQVWGQAEKGWVYSGSPSRRVYVPESALVRGTRITLVGWSPEEILEVRDAQDHRVVLRASPSGRIGFLLPEGSYRFLRWRAASPLAGLEPVPLWQNLDPRLESRLGVRIAQRDLKLARGTAQTLGPGFQAARAGKP